MAGRPSALLSGHEDGRGAEAVLHDGKHQRAVCAVTYEKGPLGLLREDLSLELLRKGLATVYKSAGAEYNGRTLEALDTMGSDARKKGVGMWSEGWPSVIVESPAEYKRRMALEKAKAE